LLASLRTLASIYTDGLWFSSVGYHNVFSTLLVVKLGLFGVFGAIFFVVMWVNLVVCDRLASEDLGAVQKDELVRRYQQIVRPYAGRLYIALAIIMALIAASGTIGEWQNWILFRHGGNFGIKDPQFGKDIGFYIFKLPFLNFVVDWTLAILIVTLVVSALFHYLNGGIMPQRGIPRVRPAVKAHISVLLALIALTKAAGYILQRWGLVNAQDGYVGGAGYTDVHARLPALLLLVVVSIFAAAILLFNIRRQGWTLPILAVGIWAFVALVVGVIYPALLQTLKVTPAQSSLEAPYIQRNIVATRAAYDLNNVKVKQYSATTNVTTATVTQQSATLKNIRLWDPDNAITLQTFVQQQKIRSYYTFPSLGVDRYTIDGKVTPVLIGVREISTANLPSQSWVNEHLQFTHGEGVAVAVANQAQSNGNPVYGIKNVPPSSSNGLPKVTQPNVYFALGDTGYVVANTKQLEVDYEKGNGTSIESHYNSTGGVKLSSVFERAAFALRLGDFNLFISDQITGNSRIMFVRDPVQMAEKAAPFLTFNQNPYAVVNNGQIYDQPVPLLGERGHAAGSGREQPARELQLCAQLGEGCRQRLLGQDDVLRRRQERPDPAGLRVGLPEHVHANFQDEPGPAGPPALPPRHLLHPIGHLRPVPPDVALAVLCGRQRMATLPDGRRGDPVAGIAGAGHVQPAGSVGFDQPSSYGPALPGDRTTGLVDPGLHCHQCLCAGIAVECVRFEQPESECVHGGHL
jgi:hypothetical protein